LSSLPIVETVLNVIIAVLNAGGLPALLALMAVESFGIPPLPSEVILPFAGFLVAEGSYPFAGAFAAALAGGVIGAYAAYAVGRWGRHLLVSGPRFLRLQPRHLAAMDEWFRRRGEGTVLVSRLLPVVRSYISYPAGTAEMEPVRFGAYTAVGAAPFTVALLYAGMVLGDHWSVVVPYLQYADYAAVVLIVIGLAYLAIRWGRPARQRRPPDPPAP
jgi:membrane protein DedA with SNARE-associated domain